MPPCITSDRPYHHITTRPGWQKVAVIRIICAKYSERPDDEYLGSTASIVWAEPQRHSGVRFRETIESALKHAGQGRRDAGKSRHRVLGNGRAVEANIADLTYARLLSENALFGMPCSGGDKVVVNSHWCS